MKILERFHQPENFDAVADGAGWVMYAGGNDWENGITGVAVTFPSDEQLKRIWFTVKHKHDPGDEGREFADETKEWGHKAWRAWKREATAAHRNKNHGTRSWQDAFKTALTSEGMKPYVKEWGTERTKWDDVKESACYIVNGLLEMDVDAPDLEHWSKRISIEEQLDQLFGPWRQYYKDDPKGEKAKHWENWFEFGPFESRIEFTLMPQKPSGHIRYELEQGDWKHHNSEFVTGQANVLKMVELLKESLEQLKAAPPTKITDVVRALERPISYAYGVERYGIQNNHQPERRDEGRVVHHRVVVGDPDRAKVYEWVKEILSEGLEDEPKDVRSEVDRLLPTKTYVLKGSSMINAAGVIRMAQNEWQVGRKKQKAWAMGLVKSWPGLPEEAYLAILNGGVEVEANGDDAVVTIKEY